MKVSLDMRVEGEPAEVIAWFIEHFGSDEGASLSLSGSADAWTPELADRFLSRISPRARDLLYALANSGPRGLDSDDLGMHYGLSDDDIHEASASISELAAELNTSAKGLGGVMSSISVATKNRQFPQPYRWDADLDAYVMHRSVAEIIGAALNRFDADTYRWE